MPKRGHSKPATISLSLELVDLLTAEGSGKRIDATFADGTGKKRKRVEIVTSPRQVSKKPHKA